MGFHQIVRSMVVMALLLVSITASPGPVHERIMKALGIQIDTVVGETAVEQLHPDNEQVLIRNTRSVAEEIGRCVEWKNHILAQWHENREQCGDENHAHRSHDATRCHSCYEAFEKVSYGTVLTSCTRQIAAVR